MSPTEADVSNVESPDDAPQSEGAVELGDVLNAGIGVPTAEDTPAYVHVLLDALLRHVPIDFRGMRIPDDVRARLDTFFAEQHKRLEALDLTFEVGKLTGLLAVAVQQEFGGMISAANDESWLAAGMGILTKMQARQVGWYLPVNDRAHHFVRVEHFPEAPPQSMGPPEDWIPVFSFGR